MGKLLGAKEIRLLRTEHHAYTQQMTLGQKFQRLAATWGLLAAVSLLCGFFIYQSRDRSPIMEVSKLLRLVGFSALTIIAAVFASRDPFHIEIVPVTLFAISAALVYGRPTALMLSAAICLVIAFSTGGDLAEYILTFSAAAGAILLSGRIRNRTRLVYMGLGVSLIVLATCLGLGVLTGQSLEFSSDPYGTGTGKSVPFYSSQLIFEAIKQAAFVAICGPLMVGLLPFIEQLFDIETDLSLLELGDMSHTLLKQLAQRAPGTYNHSISVASLAESAAESIGANGLLVRVGACFHDIGKMFKPNYFVENQMPGANRHDALQPELSTLVIIAHVKDGADLAKQHNIPQRIIDFIEQHHGTTLVEYFYHQAIKDNEGNKDIEEVSETQFRYPGPKPQTKESAILMIADAVESATRALREPTSSRIQTLVDQIAMKKLLDGQFDECELTLVELDAIKQSLIKNLNAIHHGRIKYPDQQSAG
jgi:putative nucleotidyltransferase with HDIG domain